MNGNLCSCDERLERNNAFSFAEHVAVKTVLALEEYALLNPEKANPEPVTARRTIRSDAVRIGPDVVPRSKVIGTQPLATGGHEVTWIAADGNERKSTLSSPYFDLFIEDMWGKK